ncbi:Crp/Fnr family transcriptional regulator [Afifella marina]|uniref:cAMP-binding domain of CRP or a regulatory subunit of cAMP-dependent protein kinases n=1 Tax=Afifella marina DSM 2698 TaxID=1120955 RepID=A0A1G5MKM0_AFIMA|nr:Crp/Fnr family transcriptional regulator [Afifella marina]SCZ25716.1 cAMP-binding domain of CRP or a regulatory subunit of cAMP-dependent protein kinases [Afifella marina DSM 2698]
MTDQPLSAHWLDRLENGHRRRYGAGTTISYPDAGTDQLFVLKTGLARICLNGATKALTLSYLRPGGIYVTHTRAWVEALEDCEIVSWPVREMLALVSRHPELGVEALRDIGQVLAGALDLIEDLAFRPVESRLARFLLLESARQASARIRLIDHTEALASALGTSRQTLSTLVNKLIRDGIVIRDGRDHLLILDRPRLEELSALSPG